MASILPWQLHNYSIIADGAPSHSNFLWFHHRRASVTQTGLHVFVSVIHCSSSCFHAWPPLYQCSQMLLLASSICSERTGSRSRSTRSVKAQSRGARVGWLIGVYARQHKTSQIVPFCQGANQFWWWLRMAKYTHYTTDSYLTNDEY